MYHSTPSTPKTAGKAPAKVKMNKGIQTNAAISYHNFSEVPNGWGIAPASASSKVIKPFLKLQMQLQGRDIETFREEVHRMRFTSVPKLN